MREELFFGFDWEFALTDSADMPDGGAEWRAVTLPHDWSIEYPVSEDAPTAGSGGYARAGVGWYRKAFDISGVEGRYLRFDGVYMNCDVWLNGKRIGGHFYGYTPFTLDMHGALREGRNELLVRVDNSRQPNSRWYTGSGITREVWLCRAPATHIAENGIWIIAEPAEDGGARVTARVTVVRPQEGQTLRLSITDDNGKELAECEAALYTDDDAVCCEELVMREAPLWDTDAPTLYRLTARIYENGRETDAASARFGVRSIAFDAQNGFMLNGRKVLLRGVCLHHDGGCVGAAVPREIWRRRLLKLRAMGANALRMSHNPPDPALLDMADEMGFLVMDEAFDEWHTMKFKQFGANASDSRGYSERFESRWRADIAAMLTRDRNHPSIIMWSIGNEVSEQVLADGAMYARALRGLCHSYDPTRPVLQACDQVKAEPRRASDEFLNALDIVGVNYTDRWRERTETFFDEEKREHPNWLLVGTEDVAVNGMRGDYRLSTEESVWGRTPYHAHMLKAEKLWKYVHTRPFVIGDFMWTGIDYLGECEWPQKSSSAGVMDTCGFEKDGYYFYQSIWVKDRAVLHLCPHLSLAPEGGARVYPLVCYTNCFSVELFVDGESYGVKAYEFPAQGMTERWAHFDRPQSPITTNDLHLCWDVPYGAQEITAVARDIDGHEAARRTLRPSGEPTQIMARADVDAMPADGRSVAQIEIELADKDGRLVPHRDRLLSVAVEGGELLGMDNGDPYCLEPYRSGKRPSYRGRAYAVIRAPKRAGDIVVRVSSEGLGETALHISAR